MKIFLDTANIAEIKQAARIGVISGVTTNPSLMAKETGIGFEEAVREICSIVDGPVSAEVTSMDADGMFRQAMEIATWSRNVAIKLPIIAAGLEAAKRLSAEGVKTNLTLCFSANQALLAAAVGATFVSPFIGRLDDVGHDGMQVVADAVEIYRRYGLATEVIAASVRHPLHVIAAAKAGAHIATVPYKVLMQMIEHPLTDAGVKKFTADWEKFQSAK
jgi:transaldolase